MSKVESDKEVQDALEHYMQVGTVCEALEQTRLGIPLEEGTKDKLREMGLDPDLLEEEGETYG